MKAACELERNGTFARGAEYEASAITLAVGTLPVANGFGVFAKGGVALTMLKCRESGVDWHAAFVQREDAR